MRGGDFFEDDEISVSKFKFLLQIYAGGILLIFSKISPQLAAARKAAATMQISADTCSHALPCALDVLLQPVLLDSASSSCGFTFSSNYCVAMSEQLCSNPCGTALLMAKCGITPQK